MSHLHAGLQEASMEISGIGRRQERAGRGDRGPRRVGLRAALVALVAAAPVALAAAAAEPMDLANPEPRWVAVRFEVSPAEEPGRIDAVYGPPVTAWLEPEDDAAWLRVTIPGHAVESHIVAGHHPVPGTFSDFVWRFDRPTGNVQSATMEGIVVRTLDWGLARTRTNLRLRFHMDTLHAAGFREPRRVLGQSVSYFCDPDARDDCVRVRPRRYDPVTGYVNAVGSIDVENAVLGVRTFSTLGEAMFSELDAPDVRPARDALEPDEVAADARRADTGMAGVRHTP